MYIDEINVDIIMFSFYDTPTIHVNSNLNKHLKKKIDHDII